MREPRFGDVYEWKYPGKEFRAMFVKNLPLARDWVGVRLDGTRIDPQNLNGSGVTFADNGSHYRWELVEALQ